MLSFSIVLHGISYPLRKFTLIENMTQFIARDFDFFCFNFGTTKIQGWERDSSCLEFVGDEPIKVIRRKKPAEIVLSTRLDFPL